MPKGIFSNSADRSAKIAESLKRGAFFLCLNCGVRFWRKPSAIKKGDCKFCSKECYQTWQKGRPKSESQKANKIAANKKRASQYPLRKLYKFIRESNEYKAWRKSVFERDGYTCKKCGIKSSKGNSVYLNAHHLRPFALFPEQRFAIDNGVTLCKPCHDKEPKGKEIYYAEY